MTIITIISIFSGYTTHFIATYAGFRKMATYTLRHIDKQQCILLEVYKDFNHISSSYLHDVFNNKIYNVKL